MVAVSARDESDFFSLTAKNKIRQDFLFQGRWVGYDNKIQISRLPSVLLALAGVINALMT
jgi:hypothetical protein